MKEQHTVYREHTMLNRSPIHLKVDLFQCYYIHNVAVYTGQWCFYISFFSRFGVCHFVIFFLFVWQKYLLMLYVSYFFLDSKRFSGAFLSRIYYQRHECPSLLHNGHVVVVVVLFLYILLIFYSCLFFFKRKKISGHYWYLFFWNGVWAVLCWWR